MGAVAREHPGAVPAEDPGVVVRGAVALVVVEDPGTGARAAEAPETRVQSQQAL
jgi:hypothetical protein